MFYFLPKFEIRSSRFTWVDYRLFEVWSPNSISRPFYPGVRDPDHVAGLLEDKIIRCDGHAGRFDPTVSPQHYDDEAPWLGYIKLFPDHDVPEFNLATVVWHPFSVRGPRGRVELEYLSAMRERYHTVSATMESLSRIQMIHRSWWNNRPSCDAIALEELTTEISFGLVVQMMNRAQKSVKLVDAWNRMAAALLHDYDNPNELANDKVDRADSSLMGVWLNGTTKSEGYRLLRHRVPCYILSEVSTDEDRKRSQQGRIYYGFLENSLASSLSAEFNPYDRAARISGVTLLDTKEDFGIAENVPEYQSQDYVRTSPTVQAAGEREDTLSNPVTPAPAATTSSEILPPKIMTPGPGSWTHWLETTLDNHVTPCFEQVSARRARDIDGIQYYDRERRRFLFFDEEPLIPEHYRADPRIWGLPVPIKHFVQTVNHKNVEPRPLSLWMYPTERPEPGDAGREYHELVVERRKEDKGKAIARVESRGRTRSPMSIRARSPPARENENYYSRPRSPSRSPQAGPSGLNYYTESSRRLYDHWSPEPGRRRPNYRSPSPYRGRKRRRSFSWELTERTSIPRKKADSRQRRSRTPEMRDRSPYRRSPSLESYRSLRSPSPAMSYISQRSVSSSSSMVVVPMNNSTAPVEQLVSPMIVDDNSTSSAIAVTSTFPAHDSVALNSLQNMFPAATTAPVPIIENLDDRVKSRYLMIWNLPVYYVWQNVVDWTTAVLQRIGNPHLYMDIDCDWTTHE
ncbi:hypothetical protein HYPSUDRAFT_58654 [Hypholoma sublateritium FD-334 SS-4]|uniref:Uncharacterized protein n=1 Tax=Hypholoma sublateritium (strain FD-334 SS-4) TaxID=945553 RepID=A0A0D2LXW5_HYPSF|nr:hypothetical protein HYPSUDRAFT_58654 [Hypholoma sublateritium FD-334 SS-4]